MTRQQSAVSLQREHIQQQAVPPGTNLYHTYSLSFFSFFSSLFPFSPSFVMVWLVWLRSRTPYASISLASQVYLDELRLFWFWLTLFHRSVLFCPRNRYLFLWQLQPFPFH